MELTAEKNKIDEEAIIKAKRKADSGNRSDDEEEKTSIYAQKLDPKRFDILKLYDLVTFQGKDLEHIVLYDEKEISFKEIYGCLGSTWRPKENPKYDPPVPEPVEKKPKLPTAAKVKEQDAEGNDLEGLEVKPLVEEPEEEEPYEPPVDKFIYYDFKPYKSKEQPILLS